MVILREVCKMSFKIIYPFLFTLKALEKLLFLCPLKTSEKLWSENVFLTFSGGIETKAFWCFYGEWKENIGLKCVKAHRTSYQSLVNVYNWLFGHNESAWQGIFLKKIKDFFFEINKCLLNKPGLFNKTKREIFFFFFLY